MIDDCMNDTFDNYTFSNISNDFLQTQRNSQITIAPVDNTIQKEIEWLNSNNISLDDTIFFNSAEYLCSKSPQKAEETKLQENSQLAGEFSQLCRNTSLNRTLFSESDDNLFDLDDSLKNSTIKSPYKSEKSRTSLGFSESWRSNTDAEASFNIPKEINESVHNQPCCASNELAMWGLPPSILAKYHSKNITTMFQWQVDCLNNPKILTEHKNLVYSAPTSAGKTLVSEILTIKTIFERKKKAIFILPFVSVVREKMFYFQEIFAGSGMRVDGFMGSYSPPGGFQAVHLAICTIEKANSLVNRLLIENGLSQIGAVIIDEMHLLGDPHRGYLLELLLTKLRYICCKDESVSVQIVGMSATLPNLPFLAGWLKAELFITDFRPIPLQEQAQIGSEIINNKMESVRSLQPIPDLETDADNILQLCLETIFLSCSVLIFCPTKNWCENLAQQIAMAFWKLGTNQNSSLGVKLRDQLKTDQIVELLGQLKFCPVGLDAILKKTVSFGVAFHHAGLTMDERDIIEGGFRSGALRVLVATSTLSSGVNLPARRVIIRTPIFHGKPIDTLTYRQMIGRAGRMGKDTAGESILICQGKDREIVRSLMSAELEPIASCLEGDGKLKRAILEVVASGVASTKEDVELFTNCTLLAQNSEFNDPIEEAIDFLTRNEFIRLQDGKYSATNLGKACLASSMAPEEGLSLFTELEKARQCFVLETELHLIYLVTPYSACHQWGTIDWILYLDLWEKLPTSMKKVGELVGITEGYLVLATRGKTPTATSVQYHKLMIHKRFFVALALQDLVNEKPLGEVCAKFNCNRGMLQSLQLSASTFAGMVTAFSRQLGWSSVEILIGQFQDRLHFGVSRDLLDLMRLPLLNGKCARVLFNGGVENLVMLANSTVDLIEDVLHKAVPFESEKLRAGETEFQRNERNKFRNIWITGKEGLTEREAAELLVVSARNYLQSEMGLKEAKWEQTQLEEKQNNSLELSGMSDLNISGKKEFVEPQIPPIRNASLILEENGDKTMDVSLNSSSDLITNSQDESHKTSLIDWSVKYSLRKRRANNTSFENSPSKKKKVSRKPNLFPKKILIDTQKFDIVHVCQNSELFEMFFAELKRQTVVSIATVCVRANENKQKIGILQEISAVSSPNNAKFQRGNRRVVGFSLYWGGTAVFWVDLNENDRGVEAVKWLCGQEEITVQMFDAKEQIKILKRCCHLELKGRIEDAKVLDWILEPDSSEKNLQGMIMKYCPELVDFCKLCGPTKTPGSPSLDLDNSIDNKLRSTAEALINFHLVTTLKDVVYKQNPKSLTIFESEMECLQTVARMELTGIGLNPTSIKSIVDKISKEKTEIEKKAFNLAGRRFSFSSSKEVARVLNLPKKSGTSKRILLKNGHPISELVLEWRKLSGVASKMVEPLLRAVEDDRIHGTCVLHTATGRISMHEPNLQNVAKDFTIAASNGTISCRDAFQPREGHVFVSADYCQLELRLLAHLSQDELLCTVMRQKSDVFKSIAAKWNQIKEDEVEDDMRQRVKFICYGIIYGMGSKSLAEQMGIEEIDAEKFMETFKETYPGLRRYVAEVVEECRKKGFVETVAGRRRYLPQINSDNPGAKNQAERQAVNTTVQGSAADIVKKCMVQMDEKCQMFRNRPKLVLHLHDELLYEVPKSTLRKFALTLKQTMENSVGLSIPFPVKMKSGPSWGQLTEYNP